MQQFMIFVVLKKCVLLFFSAFHWAILAFFAIWNLKKNLLFSGELYPWLCKGIVMFFFAFGDR